MRRLAVLLATGCGAGYAPIAPGTAGSLVGVAFAWVLRPLPFRYFVAIAVVFSLAAVWIADRALPAFRSKDPPQIVIDEIAGYLIAAMIPSYLFVRMPWGITFALVFVLFRVFDIFKPWPCRRLERLPGGWGVVADDVAAGVYAGIAAALLIAIPILWIAWQVDPAMERTLQFGIPQHGPH